MRPSRFTEEQIIGMWKGKGLHSDRFADAQADLPAHPRP